tara:strand:- start:116 stop:1165 length:1050 start_codon:yes stop_codon:yes gene_type:complete
MITKNEELFLEQCLNSVKDLVDEIIVVDTGSTDKTKEIAKKFTDRIFDFKWCDDFSKARNESLKYATKEWILVLDADESLSETNHSKIRELLRDTNKVGFSLIHRNYIDDSNAAGWVASKTDSYPESKVASGWYPEPIIRLFKNNKNISYKGVVHESVYDSLVELGEIANLKIPIHHYGKLDKEKLKQKDFLYEKLGQKKAIEGKDFYAFYELGRQYLHNGKLVEAVESFEKSIELKRDYFESWFMLGSTYLLKNELDNALSKLRKAQSLNQNYPPIYANLGVIFAKKKEFEKAIKNLIKAVKLNPNDASAFKNLGMCYDEMGDKKNAYLALRKAVELNPRYKESIKFS